MKRREITDIQEVKRLELEILDEVARFCEENHLKYFLAYGTLIGTIRHQGFIPWDDDIDILMPRKDYERLIRLWDNQKGRYRLLECTIDHRYEYPFAKMVDSTTVLIEQEATNHYEMGLYVDIFPYDGVKYPPEQKHAYLDWCQRLEKMRCYSMLPMEKFGHVNKVKNFMRRLEWILLRAVGAPRFARMVNRLVQRYSPEETRWAGCLCTPAWKKEVLPAHVFEEGEKKQFEDRMFRVPKEYDTMLRMEYGDYMQLPPVEQQCSNHSFRAWKMEE